MEHPIPYPHPDYDDPDLLLKEVMNGTFALAVREEIKNFSPAMARYSITEDKLQNIMLRRGDYNKQMVDRVMHDNGIGYVKQLSALPLTIKDDEPEPDVVYDPRDHYSEVEYIPYSTSVLDIGYIDGVVCMIPHYDPDDPGLFGFQEIVNDSGEIKRRNVVFCSLKTYTISVIGEIPQDVDFESWTWVGYVRGALILYFQPGVFVSFAISGEGGRIDGFPPHFVNFGDDGCFAVDNGSRTFVYDINMNRQITAVITGTEVEIKDYLDGPLCTTNISVSSSFTPFPFGTKIGRSYYFARDDTTSNKWRKTSHGWVSYVHGRPTWKYSVMVKYDFATDNWINEPLRYVGYNLLKNSVSVAQPLPGTRDACSFVSSDRYGDFVKVGNTAYHTYDFKTWEPISEEASSILYGTWGRIWINGRSDGVKGVMPYTHEVKSSVDDDGNPAMVEVFRGFVFR